jgi:SAM-dependent methyltransferase
LKILELGSGSGENLSLALEHGAYFVAGLDLSPSLIHSSLSHFHHAGIDAERFLLNKANIFSLSSCEMSLSFDVYGEFFDKVFSCWTVSQARSLQEVRELIGIAEKYLKPNGDLVLLIVNPLIIQNFPQVKVLPRIENFRLVDVEAKDDHFKVRAEILQTFSEEVMMEVFYNVFAVQDILEIAESFGLSMKKVGGLDMSPKDDFIPYQFEMICKEISKDVTLGNFVHLKKVKNKINLL